VYQRVEHCPKYATVLRQWIEGVSIDEILRRSGLNPSVDASLLEGTLPNDSYWVLSSLVDMPSAVLGAEAEQRNRIQQIANYCKFGTKDPVAISLLEIGFKHLGRGTALKLASFMEKSGKYLKEIEMVDLASLFPGRTDACNSLYEEIAAYSKNK
jgi:hypothetical protein